MTEIWGPDLTQPCEGFLSVKGLAEKINTSHSCKAHTGALEPTSQNTPPPISQVLYFVDCYQCCGLELTMRHCLLLITYILQIKSAQLGTPNCFIYYFSLKTGHDSTAD